MFVKEPFVNIILQSSVNVNNIELFLIARTLQNHLSEADPAKNLNPARLVEYR